MNREYEHPGHRRGKVDRPKAVFQVEFDNLEKRIVASREEGREGWGRERGRGFGHCNL